MSYFFPVSAPFHFISNALHFRPFHSPLPPAMQRLDWNTPAGTEDISQPLNSISSLTTASVSPHIIAAEQESSYKVK